jgi:hypothetical protein
VIDLSLEVLNPFQFDSFRGVLLSTELLSIYVLLDFY